MTISNVVRLITMSLLSFALLFHSSIKADDWIYTTVQGDSLWNLSERHLDKVTRYEKLKKINGIKQPLLLQPGTQIRIPMKWVKSNSVPARIISIQGKAQVIRAQENNVEEVSKDTLIYLGDKLKSGENSSLAVQFADKSILSLQSNSILRFDHLSAHGTTGMVDSRVHLLQGRMDTRVISAKGPGSRFEIHTPSAISAVRGTEYRVSASEKQKSSSIEVLKGKVVVSASEQQQMIKSGFGTKVAAGEAPLPPQKLLPAPSLQVEDKIDIIHSKVAWASVPDGKKYRVEMALENSFNTILWQTVTDYTQVALPDVADGKYYLRVRAIDKLGLEGHSAVTQVELDAHPVPPIQLKPIEASVSRGVAPELQWTSSSDADSYILDIASDAEFKNRLIQQKNLKSTHFTAETLSQPGSYFWRVSSVDAKGKIGPKGIARSYEIKPKPAMLSAEIDKTDDGLLMASWQSLSDKHRYHVQLANGLNFKDLELDKKTNDASIKFAPVSGQVRYLRVRTIEPDGYPGAWGTVQKIDPVFDETIWLIPILGLLGLILL